jgi:hypothetical protein
VTSHPSLRDLLLGARRREYAQMLLDRGSQALAVGMAGVILLLLLGTQIVEWYWVAFLVVASLAAGLWRVRSSIPSLYSLAQRIDHRLNLADALSTAHYFVENPDPTNESLCRLQHQAAEETARTVDLKGALPFHRSRYLLPAAGLALVAMGLFGVRYIATGSLSLQPSLVMAAYDTFFGSKTEQAKNLKGDKKGDFDQQSKDENPDNPSADQEKPPEDLLNGNNDQQDPTQGPDNSKESLDNPKDKSDQPDDSKQGDDQSDGKDQGDKSSKEGKGKEGDQNNSKDSSGDKQQQSMMDRLKDAMQNLMSSVKPSKEGQQQSAKNQSKQGNKKSDGQKGQKSDQSPQDQEAEANADQQGQEGADQQSDNKSSQKSQDKNSNQDAKNGIGAQDGDKALKQAQELEAMGKISQILGQRSAQITGEVTVEVGSSKQQLKTAWSSSQATHHDAGGEIHRDEVPLAYQEFVRQYFEEIHKPLAPAKPASPKAAAPKGAPKAAAAPPRSPATP